MKKIYLVLIIFVSLFTQNVADIVDKANKLVHEGKLNEALKLYEEAIELDGSNAVVWYNLGNAYFKAENFAKARECYFNALNFREVNDLSEVNYNIGNTYLRESKPDTAIQYYKKSLELNDKDDEAKYNMELARAILKEKAKKDKKQQGKDQKNKKQKPPKPSDFAKKKFKEAMELVGKGMFREALDTLNRAKKTDPTVAAFQKVMKNMEDVLNVLEN